MNYFADHWTMSEWLTHSARRDELITEDATKRTRLATLRDCAGIPSVANIRFSYDELLGNSSAIEDFADASGDTLYALRLNPKSTGSVLRERGRTVRDLITWARQLQTPENSYDCVFEQHVESKSSAIFVCSTSGVWGEFHEGPLLELNRGSAADSVTQFGYSWQDCSSSLPSLVEQAVDLLEIREESVQNRLKDEYDCKFEGSHLLGYFEVISDIDGELWFVDYNRLLITEAPQVLTDAPRDSAIKLHGQTGSRGKGRGAVLHAPEFGTKPVPENTVLVAHATRPELIEMMAYSQAVVTEVGGVLSHAAIACRELRIPCIVGVQGVTSSLPEGIEVAVDADAGRIEVVH